MFNLFLKQYNTRYLDLLHTINQVLFNKMDSRLWDYLKEKKRLYESDLIKIAHRQIAADLGTAREVVSRVMKKLEPDGKVLQQGNSFLHCLCCLVDANELFFKCIRNKVMCLYSNKVEKVLIV